MKYLKKIIRKIGSICFYVTTVIYIHKYRMSDKKVCFLSDNRNVMGGNFAYIYNYLDDKNYDKVIELKADRRIKRTIKQNLKLIYNLVTSKYIILEDISTVINVLKVRDDQEIVQVWHGPGAYKKFGWSRATTGENVGKIHKGYKKYTKASVSGEGIRWCYAEAFSMSEDKVKATGFPRTDCFFNKDYLINTKKKFYSEYPQLEGKKIILFAPTYRGTLVHDASYDFSQINYKALYEKYHNEYVFIIKWHPALYNNIYMGKVKAPDLSEYGDFYLDLSKYRDINDLLIACDTLITDYSSLIFDYVLLNKPIVYFAYDLDEYSGKGGRGLYFDFDEYVYGTVAYDFEQLINAIESNDLMENKRKMFYQKFMGECDGHSTQKTCKWIFGE